MVNPSNLNLLKTPIPIDTESNGRNHANLKNDNVDAYDSYSLAIDIEKEKIEAPKSTEEMSGNVKMDDCISLRFCQCSAEHKQIICISEDVSERNFITDGRKVHATPDE
ncbi:putative asparagine synthetase [glutamine-hydrolyzing] 3-like [Capsicum annuum]|nr:putative asparagine synthetase [glutamine-hydrolyzing] 3-like [Capsicum annuum]